MPENLPEERPQRHPIFNSDNAYELAKMAGAWATGLGPLYTQYKKAKGLLDVVGSADDAYGVMTGEPYASAKAFYGDVPVINYTHFMEEALRQRQPSDIAAPVLSYEGSGLTGDPQNLYKIVYGDAPAGGLLRMVGK